jgi:hypothetical protein
MDTDYVTAADVTVGTVLVADSTIQKLLTPLLVVNIRFVLVVFIDVVLENVLDVMDVLPM